MTSEKRAIFIAHDQGLSAADRKALESAGFVVVRVKRPSDVRMLTAEGPPIDGNDMLYAAIKGFAAISSSSYREEAKAASWTALCNLAFPPTEAKKP